MKKLTGLCLVLILLVGCYHSTGIEEPESIVSKIDENNVDNYVTDSPKAMAGYGDYYLSNESFEIIIDGGIVGERKQNYLAPTGGNILDISTVAQIDSLGNKLSSRNDNINQIFQVINGSYGTPVAYTSITVQSFGEDESTIVVKGYPMDKDGTFARAGFTVDPDTGLVRSIDVETTYHMGREDIYLSMTTVVRNNSSLVAPIFTVGDYHFLGGNALRSFIPAPGFGYFLRGNSPGFVHVPFVSFDEHKMITSPIIYEVFAPDDGTLMCSFNSSNQAYSNSGAQYVTVNKTASENDTLDAGSAITFVRYLYPSKVFGIHTPYGYIPTDLVTDIYHPRNLFTDIGTIAGTVENRDNTENMIIQAEQIIPGLYFNGSEIVESSLAVPYAAYRAGAQGNFTFQLPAGMYQLRISGNGIENYLVTTYTFSDYGDPDDDTDDIIEERPIELTEEDTISVGTIYLESDGTGNISFSVKDETDSFTPCRASVFDSEGNPEIVGGIEDGDDGTSNFFMIYYGEMGYDLPLGEYSFILNKGPLYDIEEETVTVSVGENEDGTTEIVVSPATVEKTLDKVVDTGSYLSFDPSIKTFGSFNCSITPIDRIIEAFSEDLDILLIRDVNTITDAGDYTALLEARYKLAYDKTISIPDESLRVIQGTTLKSFYAGSKTPVGFGEVAVFPVTHDKGYKGFGVGEVFDRTFASVFDSIKRRETNELYGMIANPRDKTMLPNGLYSGLFNALGLSSTVDLSESYFNLTSELGTGLVNRDFSLVEVLSGNNYNDYLLARADWFAILSNGYRKFAAGGSGYASNSPQLAGSPRTYVNFTETNYDEALFIQAFAAGHSFISTGPFLDVTIGDQVPGNDVSVSGTNVTVSVKVQAPSWIPIEELRIIFNGEVIESIDLSAVTQTMRYSGNISVTLPENASGFIVVECGQTLDHIAAGIYPQGTFSDLYPGIQPIAFTNPFFIQ